MPKLRIAVVGAGSWGQKILKTLESIPSCIITHVETRGYRALLSHNDIDALIVATPPRAHAEVAIPFLQKGIPTFIEKPLTLSTEDAMSIAAAAKSTHTPVFVGHIHLYSPAYQTAKRLAKSTGTPRHFMSEGMNHGPLRSDYSVLWDFAPHDLSMMLDLMGEMPQSVQAWGSSLLNPGTRLYDVSQIQINFTSGVIGFITNSRLSPEKRRKLTIVGSKQSVVYDDTAAEKVILFENDDTHTKSYPPYGQTLPLTCELESFIRVAQTRESTTQLESGIRVVRILEAAEESIAQGGKKIVLKTTD